MKAVLLIIGFVVLLCLGLLDRHITNLRDAKCSEGNTQVVMVYAKAYACPKKAGDK